MALIALDPPGCGCTECLTGEYKRIDHADASEVLAMLRGRLGDNTGLTFRVSLTLEFSARTGAPGALLDDLGESTIVCDREDLSWKVPNLLLGPLLVQPPSGF
ncbi:hypothetical protein GCM10022221_67350 [Actinocorallia aurea]